MADTSTNIAKDYKCIDGKRETNGTKALADICTNRKTDLEDKNIDEKRETNVPKLLVDRWTNREKDLADKYIDGKEWDRCNKITGQTDKFSKINGW